MASKKVDQLEEWNNNKDYDEFKEDIALAQKHKAALKGHKGVKAQLGKALKYELNTDRQEAIKKDIAAEVTEIVEFSNKLKQAITPMQQKSRMDKRMEDDPNYISDTEKNKVATQIITELDKQGGYSLVQSRRILSAATRMVRTEIAKTPKPKPQQKTEKKEE